MSQRVKDLDLKAIHNSERYWLNLVLVSQRVKDLDLKAIHNVITCDRVVKRVSQRVKDLDLKAIHNLKRGTTDRACGVTACQRS